MVGRRNSAHKWEVEMKALKALFQFPFQGTGWQNRFLVGSLLILAGFFVPVIPLLFVSGYALRVMRQAAEGHELALPEWGDLGGLALDGLRGLVVQLVYLLPGLLISFAVSGLYFVGSFAFPLLMSQVSENSGVAIVLPLLFLFSMGVFFVSLFLGSLLTILGVVPVPMALAHMMARNELGAAFRVRQWWPLWRANRMGYLIGWVVTAGLGAVLYVVVIVAYMSCLLCCLIPFLLAPAMFYLMLVTSAVFGQVYHEGASASP
jgi:hypothetical protein